MRSIDENLGADVIGRVCWIAFADRLPPENTPVLIYGPEDHPEAREVGTPLRMRMAVYEFMRLGRMPIFSFDGVTGYDLQPTITPTHWMPLPEPPT
jgi:hypothetical protein